MFDKNAHFSVCTVINGPLLEPQTCNVTPLGGSVGRCRIALEGSFGGCKEAAYPREKKKLTFSCVRKVVFFGFLEGMVVPKSRLRVVSAARNSAY